MTIRKIMHIPCKPFGVAKLLQDAKAEVKHKPALREKVSFRQYRAMVDHVKSCSSIDVDTLRVLGLIVYGWMPTILDSEESENVAEASLLLCKVKSKGYRLNEKEMRTLKSVTNNSFVGMSKLLHFVRPNIYPIWDANVAEAVDIKGEHNSLFKYRDYMDCVHVSINKDRSNTLKAVEWCSGLHHGYKVTPVRAIELCLHLIGSEKRRRAAVRRGAAAAGRGKGAV